ncbi:MAG: hypothetical protein ABEJ69_00360 [Candidatus Nanohaloarchaea archaeon]
MEVERIKRIGKKLGVVVAGGLTVAGAITGAAHLSDSHPANDAILDGDHNYPGYLQEVDLDGIGEEIMLDTGERKAGARIGVERKDEASQVFEQLSESNSSDQVQFENVSC